MITHSTVEKFLFNESEDSLHSPIHLIIMSHLDVDINGSHLTNMSKKNSTSKIDICLTPQTSEVVKFEAEYAVSDCALGAYCNTIAIGEKLDVDG
jgi:hypothetical protein